jgi:arylsulfatase A-like enzyme
VLDGTSYSELLTHGGKADRPRPPVFQHFPGYLGAGGGTWRTAPGGTIRDGDWKLIEFFETGRLELYNLKNDIGERRDLAASQPEKLKDLHAQLLAWRKATNAPMPTKNVATEKSGKPRKRKKQKLSVEDESE